MNKVAKSCIIDDLAYICKKKAMKYASQDYKDNAYGMSYASQFLKKGKRGKDGSADNPDNVKVGCEKGKPCPAYEGAGGASNQSNKGSGSTGKNKGASGEKNEVMSVKQKEKREKEFAENKAKAFVPSTKKTFVGPPTPAYAK
jgi:hypothetical protein